RPRQPARQSALAAYVDPMRVLNSVLGASVSLPVGDLLGVSKELATLLNDSLKSRAVQNVPELRPAAGTTRYSSTSKAPLIELPMHIGSKPIRGILDTGSELNII
ncbi:hypothetical protein BV25DRAFT_1767739, partial [Artomyces pyxidatus]